MRWVGILFNASIRPLIHCWLERWAIRHCEPGYQFWTPSTLLGAKHQMRISGRKFTLVHAAFYERIYLFSFVWDMTLTQPFFLSLLLINSLTSKGQLGWRWYWWWIHNTTQSWAIKVEINFIRNAGDEGHLDKNVRSIIAIRRQLWAEHAGWQLELTTSTSWKKYPRRSRISSDDDDVTNDSIEWEQIA